MTRVDDVVGDLKLSMKEMSDPRLTFGIHVRAIVRVLGSIAVTLAMMHDQKQEERNS